MGVYETDVMFLTLAVHSLRKGYTKKEHATI
jgi:hypothetical protein